METFPRAAFVQDYRIPEGFRIDQMRKSPSEGMCAERGPAYINGPPRTEIGLNRWNYRRWILHTPRRGNAFATRNSFCATQHSSFPPLSKKETDPPLSILCRPFQARRETDRCRGYYPVTPCRVHLLVSPSTHAYSQREKHGKVVIEFSIPNIYIYIYCRTNRI